MKTIAAIGSFAMAMAAVMGMTVVSAPASNATDQLLVLTPTQVVVAMPLPGHTEKWELSATNPGDKSVGLALTVAGAPLHESSDIDNRLQLKVATDAGVVAEGTVADLKEGLIALESLAPGASVQVSATVHLPRDVGNEMQGISSGVILRLVATGDLPSVKPDTESPETGDKTTAGGFLPVTGVGLGVLAIAVMVIIGGFILVAAKRQREDQREDKSSNP